MYVCDWPTLMLCARFNCFAAVFPDPAELSMTTSSVCMMPLVCTVLWVSTDVSQTLCNATDMCCTFLSVWKSFLSVIIILVWISLDFSRWKQPGPVDIRWHPISWCLSNMICQPAEDGQGHQRNCHPDALIGDAIPRQLWIYMPKWHKYLNLDAWQNDFSAIHYGFKKITGLVHSF